MVKVLDYLEGMFKCFDTFSSFKNDEAIAALIKSPLNFLVKDHLRKLLEDLLNREANLVSDIGNLDLRVRFNDFLKVIFEKGAVQ